MGDEDEGDARLGDGQSVLRGLMSVLGGIPSE